MWSEVEGVSGLWEHEAVFRGGFPLRTLALAVPGGGLLITSPSPTLKAADFAELKSLGEPRYVLASNHYHHLGIPGFLKAFPNAEVLCSTAAQPRLERQMGFRPSLLHLAPALAEVFVVPPALKSGEVWLQIPAPDGPVLAVCDAFFAVDPFPGGLLGLALRMNKIRPELSLATTFRGLVTDKPTYLGFVEQRLTERAPQIVIPCHGKILRGPEIANGLLRIARARLT